MLGKIYRRLRGKQTPQEKLERLSKFLKKITNNKSDLDLSIACMASLSEPIEHEGKNSFTMIVGRNGAVMLNMYTTMLKEDIFRRIIHKLSDSDKKGMNLLDFAREIGYPGTGRSEKLLKEAKEAFKQLPDNIKESLIATGMFDEFGMPKMPEENKSDSKQKPYRQVGLNEGVAFGIDPSQVNSDKDISNLAENIADDFIKKMEDDNVLPKKGKRRKLGDSDDSKRED